MLRKVTKFAVQVDRIGPFDRKWVLGVNSGYLHVHVPSYTLVFNTFLAKDAR